MESGSFFQHDDFRAIIFAEFEKRRASKQSYSLRAFARDLELKPSTLVDVLNKKFAFSPGTARKVAAKMRLSEKAQDFFCDLILSHHGRSKNDRKAAAERLQAYKKTPDFHQLDTKGTSLFSKWYYVATLELASLKQGHISVQKIADAFNISLDLAEQTLNYLCARKALQYEDKKYLRNHDYYRAESPTPNVAIRAFHKQILGLAETAIEDQPIPERKSLSTILSFDSRRIEEARKAIEKFHTEFFNEFEVKDGADSLYAVSLQLFRVDMGKQQQ